MIDNHADDIDDYVSTMTMTRKMARMRNEEAKMKRRKRNSGRKGVRLSPFRSLFATTTTRWCFFCNDNNKNSNRNDNKNCVSLQ